METITIRRFLLVWSSAARTDMRRIYRDVLQMSQSSDVADRFVLDLEARMRSVAASGYSGVPRDNIAENLRAVPYRERCFYFRIGTKELIVLRVLHGRQDVSGDMFEE